MVHLTTSYYDQEPETEDFSSLDEAMEAYHDSCDQRDDLGQSFGDVAQFRVWRLHAGKKTTIASRGYP